MGCKGIAFILINKRYYKYFYFFLTNNEQVKDEVLSVLIRQRNKRLIVRHLD